MSSDSLIPNKWRSAGIDLVRGLSVVLVVLHHIHLRFVLNHYPVGSVMPKALERVVFWSGYYAVIAFFTISGFLIATLSMRRWGELPRIDVKSFYWMRAARIFPCLVLLVAVLSVLHLTGVPGYVIKPEQGTLTRAAVAAFTFHLNWLEGTRGYLPGSWDVLWSLSVEEAFYLVFPLPCLALRRERLILIPIVALLVIGPVSRVYSGDQEPWDEYAYLSCTDAIAFGCLAAIAHARLRLTQRTLRFALASGMALALFVVVCRKTVNDIGLVSTGLYISVLELGVALTLLALAGGTAGSYVSRGTSCIRRIGRASYEIYLAHMFVVLTLMAAFKAWGGGLWSAPLWYGAMLLLSVLLGLAVSRWYSEPANAIIRARYLSKSDASLPEQAQSDLRPN